MKEVSALWYETCFVWTFVSNSTVLVNCLLIEQRLEFWGTIANLVNNVLCSSYICFQFNWYVNVFIVNFKTLKAFCWPFFYALFQEKIDLRDFWKFANKVRSLTRFVQVQWTFCMKQVFFVNFWKTLIKNCLDQCVVATCERYSVL